MSNKRLANLLRVSLLAAVLLGGIAVIYKTVAKSEPDISARNLQVSANEIRFAGKLLETSKTLPYLFLEDKLSLDKNAKYTYSELGGQKQEKRLLRIDKLVFDANSYSSRVTAFYLYNPANGNYERVLQSTKEQNEARYPETEIIFQDPLTVRFYYDISRPLGCYGDGCRSYWAEYFRWDSRQEKFVEVNNEFSDVSVSVIKIKGEPANVIPPSQKVYQYYEVGLSGLDDSGIEKALTRFKVEQDWLERNNFDKDNVAVLRYSDALGEWQEIKATKTNENEQFAFYEVQTEGFSLFAIIADKLPKDVAVSEEGGYTRLRTSALFVTLMITIILVVYILLLVRRRKSLNTRVSRIKGKRGGFAQ